MSSAKGFRDTNSGWQKLVEIGRQCFPDVKSTGRFDSDMKVIRYSCPLFHSEEDLLGAANEGRVYGIFPRGLEAAGPGSHDVQIEPDE
ncbi:unnamed protein product, partial [Dibothriocephalus latus]